jgi:hypothetical protein
MDKMEFSSAALDTLTPLYAERDYLTTFIHIGGRRNDTERQRICVLTCVSSIHATTRLERVPDPF